MKMQLGEGSQRLLPVRQLDGTLRRDTEAPAPPGPRPRTRVTGAVPGADRRALRGGGAAEWSHPGVCACAPPCMSVREPLCVCVRARACVFRKWRGRPTPRLAPEPGTTRTPTDIYPGPEDFLPSSLAILASSPLLSTSDSAAAQRTGRQIPDSRTQKTLSGGQGIQISRQETKPEIHQQIGFTPPSKFP